MKHTTRWVRAVVKDVHYRLDVNTLHRDEAADSLTLNEVGRVGLRLTQPLFYDSYRRNRTTGSFILASEETNVTVGAGHDPGSGLTVDDVHPDVVWSPGMLSRRRALAGARDPGCHRLAHRACRGRGSRPSPSALEHHLVAARPARLPPRRRQRADAG